MIESIRIKNLRSIQDSGEIQLKPINILLGTNSSGKSTFLRSFPLFSQSVNKRLRGPISWFDSSLVDFGDYKTAKNRFAEENECIEFFYKAKNVAPLNYGIAPYNIKFEWLSSQELSDLSVGISFKNDNEGTYINGFTIALKSHEFKLRANAREDYVNISIDGEEILLSEKVKFYHNIEIGFLPLVIPTRVVLEFRELILKNLYAHLRKYCDKRFSNMERFYPIMRLTQLDKNLLLKKIKTATKITSLEKATSKWTIQTPEFNSIYKLFLLLKFPTILSSVNRELSTFYQNCGYIAPMRAEANRFYRDQGLQVSDVDAYGRNLQEFIASLSVKEKRDYDDFLRKILKVTVNVTNESGLLSLRMKTQVGSFNITDMGYGYSQILPVLTKIWHDTYTEFRYALFENFRFRNNKGGLLLMEQPELHLHPAMQALIADVLINARNLSLDQDNPIIFLAETHSQAIINRLGRRIREQKISPDMVNVIIFKKTIDMKNTEIQQTGYNEKGQLKNWPFGFFDPED